ncbi:MAG: TIM barrel protein [Thiolinea sp.]
MLVSAVNHPNLKLNLDLYHAQIGEGNLIELCRKSLPWIGEIQVADVLGRMQPGTGEINYRALKLALKDMGYSGPVGYGSLRQRRSGSRFEQFCSVHGVRAVTRFGSFPPEGHDGVTRCGFLP